MQEDLSDDTKNNTSLLQNFNSDLIANLVPDIIATVDINKKYTWLNKAGLDFFGEDSIGKEASSYFVGEQKTYDAADQLFRGEKDILYLESWQLRIDGQKRFLAWWCRSLKDGQGNIIGAISTAHDITEAYLKDEKIKYSETQFHNALTLAHLGPWEYDVLNDKFTFNDTFYALFHTTAEKAGGYTMSSQQYAQKFVYPDDIPLVGAEVKKALETTDPNYTRELEHRIIYADGKLGYITVRFFIIKDNQGKTVKTFGINQDITERKHNEEILKKALEDTKRLNELMVNRELKMVELKKEVEELKSKLYSR